MTLMTEVRLNIELLSNEGRVQKPVAADNKKV